MVTAKLLVPAGAPDQASCGEMFSPLHPMPLNTCLLERVAPSLMSVEVSVKPWAKDEPETRRVAPSAATTASKRVMGILQVRSEKREEGGAAVRREQHTMPQGRAFA